MKQDKAKNIADCLVIVLGFIVVYIITDLDLFLYISFGVGILAAISHKIAYAISFIWYWIGKIMGFFVSKIILFSIFYLLLFPLSLLSKLFTKNKSITNKKHASYWVTKENTNFNFMKPW